MNIMTIDVDHIFHLLYVLYIFVILYYLFSSWKKKKVVFVKCSTYVRIPDPTITTQYRIVSIIDPELVRF